MLVKNKAENPVARYLALPAIAMFATTLHIATPAEAASRDSTRVMLLDRCVMDEYRRQRNSDGVVKLCDCASKKAVEKLDASQINGVTFGKPLSRGLRRELLAAMRTCK